MPKISVIIPVYNVEKYVKVCLDSVIIQTLEDIEILCINDGSTDNSGKILDEYALKDGRIKVIHKENEGVSITRNLGINSAIGEFVNIGSGYDMPISEIVELIKETVGYKGKLVYDTSKPDGTKLKLMDVSRMKALGWKAKTNLKEGLKIAYNDFLKRTI